VYRTLATHIIKKAGQAIIEAAIVTNQ
jgi:hypothetical protein